MSSKLNFEFVSPMASIFSGEVDSVLIAERSFDLIESSKEDFDKIMIDVTNDLEKTEDEQLKEELLIKKEILEANYS